MAIWDDLERETSNLFENMLPGSRRVLRDVKRTPLATLPFIHKIRGKQRDSKESLRIKAKAKDNADKARGARSGSTAGGGVRTNNGGSVLTSTSTLPSLIGGEKF